MNKTILFLLLFLTVLSTLDKAYAEIPAQLAIKAIMGEARGEFGWRYSVEAQKKKLHAMTLIAEAMRNREKQSYYKNNPLRGVEGIKDENIVDEDKWVWDTAKDAWKKSSHTNYLKGAYIWGNTKDKKVFAKCKWFKNVRPVLTYGKHTFYRNREVNVMNK